MLCTCLLSIKFYRCRGLRHSVQNWTELPCPEPEPALCCYDLFNYRPSCYVFCNIYVVCFVIYYSTCLGTMNIPITISVFNSVACVCGCCCPTWFGVLGFPTGHVGSSLANPKLKTLFSGYGGSANGCPVHQSCTPSTLLLT